MVAQETVSKFHLIMSKINCTKDLKLILQKLNSLNVSSISVSNDLLILLTSLNMQFEFFLC